jgi:tetrahydromethanopterin S-methyltransferase subunit E
VLAVLFLAVATTSIIAPVAWHRAMFRHRLKREIVDAASVFAKIGLTALALGIVTSLMFMLDLVVPRWLAVTLGVALAALILMTWLVAPVLRRRGLSHR